MLRLIVGDYIRTAAPVASDSIARTHDLGVSSATIRNEVAALEEAGYLSRPHPSAGSIPLDKAYRLYVETLVAMEMERIPSQTRWEVRKQLSQVERDVDGWTSVAAAILSSLVGNMAIATFPKARESRVRHLELVRLQDLLAMLIIVMEQTTLRRQLIRVTVPFELIELENSSNRVKSELQGLTRRQIESKQMDLTPLEHDVVEAAKLILEEEDQANYRDHYVVGLRNLLAQPEFSANEPVRLLVEGVEDGTLVQAVLEETPDENVVMVKIGRENRGDMLWPLSIVIGQYGIPDEAMGAVGVIGPTRMEYPKAITGVQFMSSVMSELVESVTS
jgi:heat-inducible transcriptional repressor